MMRKIGLIVCIIMGMLGQSKAQVQSYIEQHVEIAQQLMTENHIPASLILAVAIHESAAGKSKIAQYLHNHFGVKGANHSRKIRSAYKQYASDTESYQDFAGIISRKPYFSSLQNKSVETWVRKIHPGYARSRTWGAQVRQIIARYQLKKYDNERFENSASSADTHSEVANVQSHKVKKGETLSAIAKKYHTTVNQIKKLNHLSSNKLKIGKKLKI